MRTALEERLSGLKAAEHEAWCQLNFIMGRKAEVEALLQELDTGASAPDALSSEDMEGSTDGYQEEA